MSRKPEKAGADSPGTADVPRSEQDTGFFERWSKRKRRARAGRQAETEPEAVPPAPPIESAEAADETGERVLTDEDMPPLESLTEDSDYSGFLSPGVSERLRRAALRKLFSSAKLNVVDGLDDYAEDYRSFEALGDIITADMRFDMEREAERAKQALEEETRAAGKEAEVAATDPEESAQRKMESAPESAAANDGAGESHTARDGRDRHESGDSDPENDASRG